jgi:hypothetical protein
MVQPLNTLAALADVRYGSKQTYAAQHGMSALLPIATAKAKFRKRPCLL